MGLGKDTRPSELPRRPMAPTQAFAAAIYTQLLLEPPSLFQFRWRHAGLNFKQDTVEEPAPRPKGQHSHGSAARRSGPATPSHQAVRPGSWR